MIMVVFLCVFQVLGALSPGIEGACSKNSPTGESRSGDWRPELFHCMRTLAHLYPIVKMDSVSVDDLQKAALSAAALNAAAIHIVLLRTPVRNHCLLVRNILDSPLLVGYLLGFMYDIIRYYDAPHLALLHVQEPEKFLPRYAYIKLQQVIKLLVELSMRVILVSTAINEHAWYQEYGEYLRLLADFIEVWRLVTRFDTYFQQFNRVIDFNISFHVKDHGEYALEQAHLFLVDDENRKIELLMKDKPLEHAEAQEYITSGQSDKCDGTVIAC